MLPVGVKGRAGEAVVYDGLDEYVYSFKPLERLSELKPSRGDEPPCGTE